MSHPGVSWQIGKAVGLVSQRGLKSGTDSRKRYPGFSVPLSRSLAPFPQQVLGQGDGLFGAQGEEKGIDQARNAFEAVVAPGRVV